MRRIYVKYFCDDELGEADAFFEVLGTKLKLITAWSNNDASYRDEYMASLFKYLGIKIVALPKKYETKARQLLATIWGFKQL